MTILDSLQKKKPSHKLFTTINTEELSVPDVSCEVYLPERSGDSVKLAFLLTPEQEKLLEYPLKFSIKGEVKGWKGETEKLIQADEVYSIEKPSLHWGSNIIDTILVGDPRDLRITSYFYSNSKGAINVTQGSFWLTPSKFLDPYKLITYHRTGEVSVETARKIEFTLVNGLTLIFNNYFKSKEIENGDRLTFSELVAEFETNYELEEVEKLIPYLEDFLLIVSLAERQPCVCVGWSAGDGSKFIEYYRRNVTIPKINKKRTSFDTLIDIQHFHDFIAHCYKIINDINERSLINLAIHRLIDWREKTLENSFITIFSAIENIILHFRQTYGFINVLDKDQWSILKRETRKSIKKCLIEKLKIEEKEKREFIYEKIDELNRISLSSVFNKICKTYSVDLQDIWPLIDTKDGISLSNVRNKIVHGEIFNHSQGYALIAAREHLIWTLERLILSILGWPIEKSRVSREFLSSYMTMAKGWEEDRKILSS